MPSRLLSRRSCCTVTALVIFFGAAQGQLQPYEKCWHNVIDIIEGNLAIGDINSESIRNGSYMYEGPVPNLASGKRANFTTLTYHGKQFLCLVSPLV